MALPCPTPCLEQVQNYVRRLTILSPDLILGNNDLTTIRIIRPRHGMLEDTNSPDHFTRLDHPHFTTFHLIQLFARSEITRVADHLFRADRLAVRGDTCKHAVVADVHRLDFLVEHVGTTVDGRQTGKGLRELAQAVERVDVGRLAVSRHGTGVEDDTVDSGASRLGFVATGQSGTRGEGACVEDGP